MIPPDERVLKLEAVNNFRDYGGWRAADGAMVATGRLFRSAHMHRATAADIDRIGALGIATVTDLRRPSEQQAQPGAWIGKLPLAVIEEPADESDADLAYGEDPPHIRALRAGGFSPVAMRKFLADNYEELPYIGRHIALFRRYFNALATGSDAMLIHCAAGKDRTGILAWLTHRVLGVHPDDAMADYLLSNTAGNIAARLPQALEYMESVFGRPVGDAAIITLLSVEPDYIQRCEAALVARSGSVEGYVADVLGIDATTQRRIREGLLT
jgi:protein tyrosine/serine phosphatase